MEISRVILKGLIYDGCYASRVMPYLKEEYFENADKYIFQSVKRYVDKYNSVSDIEPLVVDVGDDKNIPESLHSSCIDLLCEIENDKDKKVDEKWLLDKTEEFCLHRSAWNAAVNIVQVVNGDDKKTPMSALPELMRDAVSINFGKSIGHDYFEKAEEQYAYYHDIEKKFPSKIELLNKVTNGGVPSKTLNLFLAGINVGKTIWLVDTAADYLSRGKNVLFVTFEMPEEQIRQRVDANLFNVEMNKIVDLSKDQYMNRVNSIQAKTQGNLVIKEFGAGQAHCGHIRHIINELQLKRGYKVDLICVDYLGIMGCEKLKMATTSNTNTFYTEVAKELHALGKEFDATVWTAHQYTRDGQNASDVDMTDTSAAIGIPATCDFIIAGISNDDLEAENKLLIKQLKNRYNNKTTYKKFLVGIDRAKMTYLNLEDTEQNSLYGAKLQEESGVVPKNSKKSIDYNSLDFSE